MFIANSLQYAIEGFDLSFNKWKLVRLPDGSGTEQITFVNRAKFVDKASGDVYFLDTDGNKTLTHQSRRMRSYSK